MAGPRPMIAPPCRNAARPSAGSRRTAAALALAVAACSGGEGKQEATGLGARVLAGPVRALSASPDGGRLALLDGCQEVKAQFLPPRTARCDLRVVPSGGGDARKVAAGVTTLPHAVAWRPDGEALVALADFDHATSSGTLVVWEGAVARPIADRVTFHGYGPHGELGLVSGGRLSVMLPGERAPRPIAGADQVASFEVSPMQFPACGYRGGMLVRLVARRTYAAGGELLAAGCALDRAEPLERGQVGEYGFAPASPYLAYTVQGRKGAALKLLQTVDRVVPFELGAGVQTFAFGPDGRTVAFVANAAPGRQGDLYVAAPGRKGTLLAREVGELRWAREAPRLAWLERYDPRVRSGTLGAARPDGPPVRIADDVSDFEVSPDGKHVAFLQHTTRGGYSVDLGLAHLDASPGAKPEAVAQGAFGFSFSPDGRWLYYRTRCVRNAEACDLERVPASGLSPGARPERVADGVKSFEFDPRDPERLLLTWQRMDMVALDVAVYDRGRLTRVDTAVVPGTARFLGPDSTRVAYAVAHPKRHGVYVAALPPPGAGR